MSKAFIPCKQAFDQVSFLKIGNLRTVSMCVLGK